MSELKRRWRCGGKGLVGGGLDALWAQSQNCQRCKTNKRAESPQEPAGWQQQPTEEEICSPSIRHNHALETHNFRAIWEDQTWHASKPLDNKKLSLSHPATLNKHQTKDEVKEAKVWFYFRRRPNSGEIAGEILFYEFQTMCSHIFNSAEENFLAGMPMKNSERWFFSYVQFLAGKQPLKIAFQWTDSLS